MVIGTFLLIDALVMHHESGKSSMKAAYPFLLSRELLKTVCAALLLSAGFVSRVTGEESSVHNLYVSYHVYSRQTTESDDRQIMLAIFLDGGGHPGYRYSERILGSKAKIVKSVSFYNEYPWDQNLRTVTLDEKVQLARKLLQAKIFEFVSDPKDDPAHFTGYFDIRLGDREAKYFFFTPPHSTDRRAIHDIMLGFAKEMGVDRPKDLTKATTFTEGDLEPAREVSLSELLADPTKYHSKRVSVVGFYHREFESSSLSLDDTANSLRNLERGIWRGAPSSFANQSSVQDRNDSWLRVEGIFLKGPAGHMSAWPGEIVRLTRIEPIQPPSP